MHKKGEKALVLSHRLNPAVYHQALGAGAAEVLSTSAPIEELINALRRTVRRKAAEAE